MVNQGGDVPDGNFDLQMGDGGFGIFDACVKDGTAVPQYDGTGADWGNQYGGWYSRSDCYKLPQYPHCNTSNADNMQACVLLPSAELFSLHKLSLSFSTASLYVVV